MTIDPKVAEARANLSKLAYDRSNHNIPVRHEVREELYERGVDVLLSAVRTAHLQELRGETEEETAGKFHTAVVDAIVAGGPLPGSKEEPHTAVFRALEAVKANEHLLTTPLRAKLQAQEARIKALEAHERNIAAIRERLDRFKALPLNERTAGRMYVLIGDLGAFASPGWDAGVVSLVKCGINPDDLVKPKEAP